MIHSRIITENQLDQFVRGNNRIAQGLIVELVYRLAAASVPDPLERRFPLGDSVGQHGPDGILDCVTGFSPFVPDGRSYWEVGTGRNPAKKATSDYNGLIKKTAPQVRSASTFIFVTPLSGVRGWTSDNQDAWIKRKTEKNEWKNVKIIDGTKLIDWLFPFPGVERWLTEKMGISTSGLMTPEERWDLLKETGAPYHLQPKVFLVSRESARQKLDAVFSGNAPELRLESHYPDQVIDLVVAYLADTPGDNSIEIRTRSLIISNPSTWEAMAALKSPHILIADFDLDDNETIGTRLLQLARSKGHSIIYGSAPTGIPNGNRVQVSSPRPHEIEEALVECGYARGRAHRLALRSAGNLSALKRCLRNLEIAPEWAQGTAVEELAIAELIGAWNEGVTADKAVVEKVADKEYGEWIATIRGAAHIAGTPLIQREDVWKFVSRYEGWYALGPRIYNQHLDRLKDAAIMVLRERDPRFELPPGERYAASVHGKVLKHSRKIRNGLAEALALLGSHSKALTSCSIGKPEAVAGLAVREILADADWVLWGSLNSLLPLLGEASPAEFLDAVENSLKASPCPFDNLFSQEGDAITGTNYLTGVLWSLETLAWDPEYLTRVVVILGDLGSRDPGGRWSNRPSNSLSMIFLPWMPQTCAPLSKKKVAVETLIKEFPEIAWELLLTLLPQSHQISTGTRKPVWRETIPLDWTERVTRREYWDQIAIYTELAIGIAQQDLSKLAEIIERMDDLPTAAQNQLLDHLASDTITSLPESARVPIWTELTDLVIKHKKYADAPWALQPETVDKIERVAEKLQPHSPTHKHQRLFSERDFELIEERGDYNKQRKQLEEKRHSAIAEILEAGEVNAVLDFAQTVESPWRVGQSLGMIADKSIDDTILPDLLESSLKPLAQLAGGYVWGRFRKGELLWIDDVEFRNWTPSQIGQFLAYLPFHHQTWQRASNLLGEDESPYWIRTHVNPYEARDDLEFAVDRLFEHGMISSTIQCLDMMIHEKHPIDNQKAISILDAALESDAELRTMDTHAIVEIIKYLQSDKNTDQSELARIEWKYLRLLQHYPGVTPKVIEQHLAQDPSFFCQVIRIMYLPEGKDRPAEEPSEELKAMASNAWHLLWNWKTPPGLQGDGTYSASVFETWMGQVKESCQESGHIAVALTHIGHVLVYCPRDPDGLWLPHAVAIALNDRESEDMRTGFMTELFNSRGTHTWTAGREERELASKYRVDADAVEAHGYHRLATALRKVAESYRRDAEREASREKFED